MSLTLDLSLLERTLDQVPNDADRLRLMRFVDWLRDCISVGLLLPYFDDLPTDVEYACIDRSGQTWGYADKPIENGVMWRYASGGQQPKMISISPLNHWRETLRKRPTK